MTKAGRNLGLAACAAALLLLLFAAVSGAFAAEPTKPQVMSAWVKLPVVPGRPGAAYAMIMGGAADDALVAVEGPAGTRAEMHSTTNANGIMKMAPLKRLPVPAGGHVMLEPGGAHVMLFGLKDVKPGGTAPLTFVFEKAGRVPVTAELRETGAPTHAH